MTKAAIGAETVYILVHLAKSLLSAGSTLHIRTRSKDVTADAQTRGAREDRGPMARSMTYSGVPEY